MLSELGRRPMLGGNEGSFGDEFEKEFGMLLREQRRQEADDRERELNLYRSGSAPPTVEGSLSAVGGLFGGGGGAGTATTAAFSEFSRAKNGNGFASEEELRSDPAYLSYYYSNVNLNPRLPPPLLSKEDWRFTQRLKSGASALGGIGDRRKVNRSDDNGGRSMLATPPGFNLRKQENEVDNEKMRGSAEWGGDGLIGLPGLGLGSKQKSLAEIFQVACFFHIVLFLSSLTVLHLFIFPSIVVVCHFVFSLLIFDTFQETGSEIEHVFNLCIFCVVMFGHTVKSCGN